jgi:hypothetical protein
MSFRRAPSRVGRVAAISLAILLHAGPAQAQSAFEDVVRQYSATSITGYVQPLADVLVANLSSGYFFNAGIPKSKLGFGLEFIGIGTLVSDEMKTYVAKTPSGFNPTTFTTPTVFGGAATAVNHSTISGLSYRGSDGIVDASIFPTAVPQLRLGGIFGTEIVVRSFSSTMLSSAYPSEDLPKLKMMGAGLRHSISQYFGAIPFDVAIGGSYNTLTLGDYVDMKGMTFGANIGKSLGIVSLLGGVESSGGTMNLSYTSTDPQIPGTVDVDLDAKRQIRFSAGGSLKLGFLSLMGSAGFGNVTTFTGGLRLGF